MIFKEKTDNLITKRIDSNQPNTFSSFLACERGEMIDPALDLEAMHSLV